MIILNYIKKHKIVSTLLFIPTLLCIVCLMLVSCGAGDNMKYNDAIAIAKTDFGCDKILWIDSYALMPSLDSYVLVQQKDESADKMRSPYAYYVVGEKAGEEIYIVIPSAAELEKSVITTWSLDYSFTQIVEKFNENGAQYIADVPDDYYSRQGSYIKLWNDEERINELSKYYFEGSDVLYERLDVKAFFEYKWEEDGYLHSCIVTQEDGELKSYKKREIIS